MRLLLALLVVVSLAQSAAADTIGDGDLDPDGGTLTTEVVYAQDGTPAGEQDALAASPRVFRSQWTAALVWGGGLTDHLCDAGGILGWRYTRTRYTFAGALIDEQQVCVPLPDPDDVSSPPDPPPELESPTVAEIWHAVATSSLPRPEIGVSPITDGVTGLETWLWVASDGDGVVNATASVGAWSVVGTATRTGYSFDFGDGARSRQTSETGGSEEEPPGRWTYETKGPYRISIGSTWTAEFVLTGPGVTVPIPVDVGTAQLTTVRDYRVVEIRSVLVR